MTDEKKTRDQVHEIEIDAPPEAVWRMLTTPEGITSWFVTKADVEPGEGGRIRYVWEEMGDAEATAQIEAWEPERRLLLRQEAPGGGGVVLVEEWTIEALDGGRARLRLVQSGVPDDPSWDGFYDGTDRGWRMYLDLLAHGVALHAGRRRTAVTIMGTHPVPLADLWARVLGGIGVDPAALPAAGETVRIATAEGDASAVVLDVLPEAVLCLRLPDPGDRALALLFEGAGEGNMFWGQLSAYGDDAPDAAAWEPWLRALPGGAAS